MESTMTSKGQITVPVSIRDQLHLATGTKFLFFTLENGDVVMRPKVHSVKNLKSLLPKPSRVLTDADIKTAIQEGYAERYADH